jgi:hypothetical protein
VRNNQPSQLLGWLCCTTAGAQAYVRAAACYGEHYAEPQLTAAQNERLNYFFRWLPYSQVCVQEYAHAAHHYAENGRLSADGDLSSGSIDFVRYLIRHTGTN